MSAAESHYAFCYNGVMEPAPVDIGATIAYGVMFDPKNSAKAASMDFNQLRASAEKLFDLLEERQIDYVLVGGIAMLAYVDGRNTQDVDLILSRADVAKLPELVIEDENKEFARAKLGDLQVDCLFTNNKLFQRVASEFVVEKTFLGRQIPCATEEGLVALKLFSLPSLYRQGQFDKVDIYERDIAALMRRTKIDMSSLLETLKPLLLPTDCEELRRIVGTIQGRLDREGNAFQ